MIVGIRFQKIGKIYHFDASQVDELKVGDFAVVETSRGQQLGEVAQLVENPAPPPEGKWKPILRRATARDLVLRQLLQKKELEATINCRARLAETGPAGIKIVTAEYTFDGSHLSFLYSSEDEGKIDLRRLRSAMQRIYPRSIVEMRQIGPRDVAKFLGGMGACGLANRCCSMFLTEFSPVSIKMAKEQGISLSPTEITGMCGRLRCCLVYEYEHYVEARKGMPKRNKRVMTAAGAGKVLDIYPLKQAVMVELESGVRQEFLHADIQPYDEWEALRKKAQEPCDRHEDGECDCGKLPQVEPIPAAPISAPGPSRPPHTRSKSAKSGAPAQGGGDEAGKAQAGGQKDRPRRGKPQQGKPRQGKPQSGQRSASPQSGQQPASPQAGQPQSQQHRRTSSKKPKKRRPPPSSPPPSSPA